MNRYIELIHKLEKNRNELELINNKIRDKDIEKLIIKYDKEILEQYQYIEQFIDTKERD
jgi:hypothetical protein